MGGRFCRRLLLAIAVFLCCGGAGLLRAQLLLPMPRNFVNDSAQLLLPEENARLERMLRAYEDSTSTQIFIVTLRDLKGYDANDFTTTLGNQWGGGQRGKNNGVVLLLRPGSMPPLSIETGSIDGDISVLEGQLEEFGLSDSARLSILHRLRSRVEALVETEAFQSRPAGDYGEGYIATGYGMEAVLPDALAARIVREVMGPLVVQHRFAEALEAGVLSIMSAAAGEFSAEWGEGRSDSRDDSRHPLFAATLFLLFLPAMLIAVLLVLLYPIQLLLPGREVSFARWFFPRFWSWNGRLLRLLLLLGLASIGGGAGGGGGGGRSVRGGGGSFGGGGGGGRF